ncbi:LytR family transcriptional regulator [Actinomadura sp. LD22]|uniref:LytR family transcriptional regulator n=1 Tax=Actinomadura physcomitrii TaxID=2650748 RepID=A0A6I4M3S0_9ACTN|nr:LCP family protein [Actinomadura physcomitrii]MVZ98806.1 LytR family transcriptional regulator [Actinomadura physcomitrii]
MDDLELLRDLGRELGDEPPATLARQRGRLLDAARGRRGLRLPGGRWTVLGVVAAVTAAAILVPALVLHGRGARPVASSTPGAGAKAMNILVLGSDRRAGGPARADTVLMVHLPADRKTGTVVSIPRDSMMSVPACEGPGGRALPPRRAVIGAVFTDGGAACVRKAVESAASVPIDSTIVIEFSGFKAMVDALGGVAFTLPKAVTDARGRVLVRPGRQRLSGAEALAYVRARRGWDDGSDLARVRRQQALMKALLDEAHAVQLKSPMRFARFLAAAARSLRTSPALDLKAMESLARSLRDLDPGRVGYTTVPVRPAPGDPNRLVWAPSGARTVFAPFRR